MQKTFSLRTMLVVVALFFVSLACSQEQTAKQSSEKAPMQETGVTGNPVVVMTTSLGTIKLELFEDKAPVSVKNFLTYVDEKYYDSTVFHRVIKHFMIQGGGFAATDPIRQKSPKAPIVNESTNGLSNDRGTIAMARTNDPNSATSQFFINTVDNAGLNRGQADPNGYAVFGKVIEGMDVVDAIEGVATANAPAMAWDGTRNIQTVFQNVPKAKVIVLTARRLVPAK